jgi:hypothetical protein
LDWTCAVALGWTPSDVNRHTFPDIWHALGAARYRREAERLERWQHTGAVIDALYNYGGLRGEGFQPRRIGTFFREVFLNAETTDGDGEDDGLASYAEVVATLKPIAQQVPE